MNHYTKEDRRDLRELGWGANITEIHAKILLTDIGVQFQRLGYPDFMVLKDGEIFGFIEVKPKYKNEKAPLARGFSE